MLIFSEGKKCQIQIKEVLWKVEVITGKGKLKEMMGEMRSEVRKLAREKGVVPFGARVRVEEKARVLANA